MNAGRSSEAEVRQVLDEKARLLLRREHELFELRQARARTETWLAAFTALSPAQQVEADELIGRWLALMVGDLDFGLAAAVERDAAGQVTGWWMDPGPLPPLAPVAAAISTLGVAPTAGVFAHGAPAALAPLAAALGFELCFWMRAPLWAGRELVLCAGASPRTAPYQQMRDEDRAHFVMLGDHLAAHLTNGTLARTVDRERRELLRAQKLEALGRLAAGVAHEINNPLTYVIHSLELAAEQLATPAVGARPEVRDLLGDALVGADRIRRIVLDIHAFSQPRVEPLGVVDLAASLAAVQRMLAQDPRFTATIEVVPAAVPAVQAEPRGLERVLTNVLVNAAQALPAVGAAPIVVTTEVVGGVVVLEIRDRGCGIPAEQLDKVFDPFFTTRDVGAGAGLGLSVSRAIMASFGGSIALDSAAGRGTAVRLELPLAPSAAPLVAAPVAPTRPIRVLIVDDEALVRRSLARALAPREVVTVGSAREALRVYADGGFDLVLCDLMMPEMTGLEFRAALAARGPEHAARVVFMSGGTLESAGATAAEVAASRYLEKPIKIAELRRLVDELAG